MTATTDRWQEVEATIQQRQEADRRRVTLALRLSAKPLRLTRTHHSGRLVLLVERPHGWSGHPGEPLRCVIEREKEHEIQAWFQWQTRAKTAEVASVSPLEAANSQGRTPTDRSHWQKQEYST